MKVLHRFACLRRHLVVIFAADDVLLRLANGPSLTGLLQCCRSDIQSTPKQIAGSIDMC